MQEFEVGDKVLVPMKIVDITESGVYYLKREFVYYHVAKEIMQKFEKENECTGKTYEDGMAEAWKTARRIMMQEKDGGLSLVEATGIFGVDNFSEVFKNFTAAEAAEKIKAWEDAQEICFRDEVKSADGKTGVVTNAEHPSYPNHACVLWKDGHASTIMKGYLTKTGRKINVDKWLAEIGGAE